MASLLSSMSGAGAAMLTTPVWLFLGFPLPVAIASNQLNGAAWTLIAARNYLKGGTVDWALIRIMIFYGLAGAYVGTTIVRGADAHILQRVIGAIIIALVVIVVQEVDARDTEGICRAEPPRRLGLASAGFIHRATGVASAIR